MTHPAQSDRIVAVFSKEEAHELVDLGAALEQFIVSGSPLDTATAKLDEQVTQQMRPAVDEAADELGDRLFGETPETLTEDRVREIAEAVVRRILGVWQ